MCKNHDKRTYYFTYIWQTHEASKVFEHLTSLGLKPNAKSYSVLVDAHLINRDVKSALSVVDDMVIALSFFLEWKQVFFYCEVRLRISILLAVGCWFSTDERDS